MYWFFKKKPLAKVNILCRCLFEYGAFITSNVNHSTLKGVNTYLIQYLQHTCNGRLHDKYL